MRQNTESSKLDEQNRVLHARKRAEQDDLGKTGETLHFDESQRRREWEAEEPERWDGMS